MGLLTWIFIGCAGSLSVLPLLPHRSLADVIQIAGLGMNGAVLGGCLATLLDLGDVTSLDARALCLSFIGGLLFLGSYRLWAAVETRVGNAGRIAREN